MNLCIDAGNTRVKIAIFNNDGLLVEKQVYNILDETILNKIINNYPCKNAIISSVKAPHDETIALLTKKMNHLFLLTADLPIPINSLYETPHSLGKDRLAGVVGATVLMPKENVLVVDAGTCITYDFITNNKDYLGGSILPGIVMRFKSMANYTAQLPLVEKAEIDFFIGTTTKTSIQTGVLQGVLHEIRGFKEQYKQQFGKIKVIVTGGDASYFESQLKNEIFVQPTLVLIGLNQILTYNTK
ncbi:type III pantothenate kinase [Aureispira]|nr:type III pantothenate kinase [Aureispira sp.]